MSYALIDTTDLTTLGDAIRAKTGGSSNLTISEMATAVADISGGETIEVVPAELLNVTGNFTDGFSGYFGQKMKQYLFQMNFNNITDIIRAFQDVGRYEAAPGGEQDWSSITINFASGASYNSYSAFSGCDYIKYLPKLRFANTGLYDTRMIFNGCHRLLSVDDFMNNTTFLNTSEAFYRGMFIGCDHLESIPHLEKLAYPGVNPYASQFHSGFAQCYNLKEVLNLTTVGTYTENAFSNTFLQDYSLSRVTFETENGAAKTATWTSQTIDLTNQVGYWDSSYANSNYVLEGRNQVTDSATYEQYKNTNYYTTLVEYSRYNHDSAVETINSLPDTSATGTNTIKFLGNSGSATDGGAISSLTAEEIAVATNKGWTVTIV